MRSYQAKTGVDEVKITISKVESLEKKFDLSPDALPPFVQCETVLFAIGRKPGVSSL